MPYLAIGVGKRCSLWSRGEREKIYCGQITLCAGTVHNPAILWRSGVGPKNQLLALGVPVIADRPGIGENLIEHCQALVALAPRPGVCDPASPDVQMAVHYTAEGGPFNDMQIYCVNKLGRERFPELPGSADLLYAAMICLNRPKSRGRMALTSVDPDVQPAIRLHLNSEPEDMRRMREGVRKCWDIATTGEFAAMSNGVVVLTEAIVDDDALLSKYIQGNCATLWHPVGTCKMGPASDAMAVVDSHLRAHGLQNLRIADASIFPDHVSRNPNLTCIAVGERVAEWLKAGE